jgi:uncharacterized protein YukE
MSTVEVTAQRVWQFGTYLNSEVWGDFHTTIRGQAVNEGCNKSGFTGLIEPLQGSMDMLHGWSDDLMDIAVKRLHGVSGGLISTAYSYVGIDDESKERINDVPDNHRPSEPASDGAGVTFTTEGSPFTNPTAVTAASISADGPSITDSMDAKMRGSAAADAVNWIVGTFSEHLGMGGQDLRQLVVEPLAGDYNRVRANGVAWADVGTMLNTVLTNLGHNAAVLVTSDWTGDAAQAFLGHVDVVWAGGLYVASKCAGWMQQGFDTLADVILKIATTCARILDQLIEKIVDVAKRFVPAVGQIIMVIEWASSGFEDFPAWEDIKEIARIIDSIQNLHKTVTEAVTIAENYVKGFEQAVSVVRSIPQIDSIEDAASAANQFRDGAEQMQKARTDFDANATKFQSQLDDLAGKAPK